MEIGTEYQGFILIDQHPLPALDTMAYLFRHRDLGCQALALKNNDPNKTFCIAFRTIPEDSTGVAHILEHSVLMGSDKYPVKDVFGEINKGGLMTFLNAMTGADTTWYPFATRNLTEYFNIMDVYCDVTLYPLLLRTTFEQEGWHYHLEEEAGPLQYQGVVFNEMKGAFSDPIRALFHHCFEGLMPQSTYAHESGGDPRTIPDLTYEDFVRFHKDHYHPSNCTLFFYGDADLEQELAFVQDRFLSRFPTAMPRAEIVPGQDISRPVTITDTYPVQPGSPVTGKTFLAVSSVIGTATDRKRNTAFQVIANILYNSDASPLKNTIVNQGLCTDFGGLFLHNSSYKTVMMTYLVGSDPDKLDTFQTLYRDTLQDMVNQGLDRELVLAELNKFEFSLREDMNKAQRGLDMIGKALPAMKHDQDPFAALEVADLMAEIRDQALHQGYLEHLIKECLLDNPATVTVSLAPDPEQMARTRAREQQRLEEFADSLTPQSRQELVERTMELSSLQTQANTDADLARLPCLNLSDLAPEGDFPTVRPERLGTSDLLISEQPTNGILYLDVGFDLTGIDTDLLPYLDLFGTLVTEIGTEQKDYRQLAKDLSLYTGGFTHGFNSYLRMGQADTARPIQWFSLKCLSQNLEPALNLLTEILHGVSFHDQRRVREVVQREYTWEEHSIQSEGYQLAATRAFAALSPSGRYHEAVNGATSFQALRSAANSPQPEALLERLERLRRQVLTRDALLFSITGEHDDIVRFQDLAGHLGQELPPRPTSRRPVDFPSHPRCEAFTTSGEVVFNVQAGSLFPGGQGYRGSFEVLKTWLSRDYLWNTVRQQGGAYGCFVQFNPISGNCGMVSYRDPQISRTYQTYDQASQTIADLTLSKDMMTQLIIGTYGNYTPLQGPAGRGASARNDFLAGITPTYRQEKLEEILATSLDDLRSYAGAFAAMAKAPQRVTIGNQQLIEQHRTLFDQVSEI